MKDILKLLSYDHNIHNDTEIRDVFQQILVNSLTSILISTTNNILDSLTN